MGRKRDELSNILYRFIDKWDSKWSSHLEVSGGVDEYCDEIIKLFKKKRIKKL
jgi:hypothetical protein